MNFTEELNSKVKEIFRQSWDERDGTVVPEAESLQLTNQAVKIEGVVFYADLDGSTSLVDRFKPQFAAQIYKTFLHCASRIVRKNDGVITAYDGDRIMAVFIGNAKNTNAARAALALNWARTNIINPEIKAQYAYCDYEVKHVVGIDSCHLFVARTGVRGANDLVWVGKAANHAAKMAALSPEYPSRITAEVYDRLSNNLKISADGRNMWEQASWAVDNQKRTIYRSTWQWGY